jgi:hypothetical protein
MVVQDVEVAAEIGRGITLQPQLAARRQQELNM